MTAGSFFISRKTFDIHVVRLQTVRRFRKKKNNQKNSTTPSIDLKKITGKFLAEILRPSAIRIITSIKK